MGAQEQEALSVNLRSRESEKPLGVFSMLDFVAKLDSESAAQKLTHHMCIT